MGTKSVEFQAYFESSGSSSVVVCRDRFTVNFHHSQTLQGLTITHRESVPNNSRNGSHMREVITRTAVAASDSSGLQPSFDSRHYALRTVYAEDALTAAANAVRIHLAERLPERQPTGTQQNNSLKSKLEGDPDAREEFLNRVVEPLSTAVLAACRDASLLNGLSDGSAYVALSSWDLGIKTPERRLSEILENAPLFQDVYLIPAANVGEISRHFVDSEWY